MQAVIDLLDLVGRVLNREMFAESLPPLAADLDSQLAIGQKS
jgi:hypothetical protein